MMPRLALVLIALASLAACARSGPPAALTTPADETRRPPPARVAQAHPPHPDRVVVGAGETVYTIARHYDLPERSIIDANHLTPPYRIAAGTTLALPQDRFHVVHAGDTLYGISRLYGVELSTLAGLNHLTAPYAIRAGQTLYLPASVAPPDRTAEAVPPPTDAAPREDQAKPEPPKPAQTASTPPPPPRAGKGFEWPVQGRIIASYGPGPDGTHNDGINIAAREGEAVHAADAGVVAYAGNELRGYGNLVLIKHAGGYMTAYAHNSSLLVKRGDVVTRGQEIAKAGATGTVASPQLHFEIRRGTKALDPTQYLPNLRASLARPLGAATSGQAV